MNTAPSLDLSHPDQVLCFLLGTWELTREVPGMARAAGTAVVRRTSSQAITFSEEVTVTLASGTTLQAKQNWLFVAAQSGVSILYGRSSSRRGEFFQSLSFISTSTAEWQAHAFHLCGADHYDSTYRLEPPDAMTIRHRVDGPRKQYTVHTRYQRSSVRT